MVIFRFEEKVGVVIGIGDGYNNVVFDRSFGF